MPARRLSDPEYVSFTEEMKPARLDIPPWGIVVEWKPGQFVLVYPCKQSGFLCQGGEYLLTDVSDLGIDWREEFPPTFDSLTETWLYHFPEEFTGVLNDRMTQISDAVDFSFSNLGPLFLILAGLWISKEIGLFHKNA